MESDIFRGIFSLLKGKEKTVRGENVLRELILTKLFRKDKLNQRLDFDHFPI